MTGERDLMDLRKFASTSRNSQVRGPESALRQLADTVLDRSFPCFFARGAVLAGDVLVGLPGTTEDLLESPVPWFDLIADRVRRDVDTIVLLWMSTSSTSIEEDERFASELVRTVFEHARATWPAGEPTDWTDPRWSLWFDGIPLFLNISTPNHERRLSRNLGPGVVIVAQDRRTFDRSGEAERRIIRRRLDGYDACPAHSSLGTYGTAGNHEVLQFFLGDTDEAHHLLRDVP